MTTKRIQNITTKSHALGIVANKPRIAYDSVQQLNPSSIAEGFVDHNEIDPAKIKYAFETKRTFTAASQDRMDRGTLMHMMLLQPERLGSDVAIWPTGKTRRGGTESKPSEWDEFRAIHGHKLIICQEDYDQVSAAYQAFKFHPKLTEILTDLDAEVAIFSSENDFYVKGLIDAVTKPRETPAGVMTRKMIDLKTTEAGFSERAIETTIRNFHNREKMAAYRRWYICEAERAGTKDFEEIDCINVFLNMEEPYGIRVMEFTTQAIQWGEHRMESAFDAVCECLALNDWPLFCASGDVMVESWETDEEEIEI
jgi:hypothetical protein